MNIAVESMDDGRNVRCPRCWHWHGENENFGHLPEEIAAKPELSKEKLCDGCQQTILEHFPEHPSTNEIRLALDGQKTKCFLPIPEIIRSRLEPLYIIEKEDGSLKIT